MFIVILLLGNEDVPSIIMIINVGVVPGMF